MNKNHFVMEQTERHGHDALVEELRRACKKIAPLWPLESFVAVNPYLGMTDKKFEAVANDLIHAGGVRMTMPFSFYKEKIKEGRITGQDVAEALSGKPSLQDLSLASFTKAIEHEKDSDVSPSVSTVLDVASFVYNHDWNRFATSRVAVWAASYFDRGQASWQASDRSSGLFKAWKTEAMIDRTTEIMGLKNFRRYAKAFPDDSLEAVTMALDILDVPQAARDLYLHRLLLRTGGWAAYAAQHDWQRELYGGHDGVAMEFLTVLICWEACVLQSLDSEALRKHWHAAKRKMTNTDPENAINQHLAYQLILQDAFDRAAQRELINKFNVTKPVATTSTQPRAQAIFCIDVRSEVFRRNLERVDGQIETLGFAGFFAFPITYIPIGHDEGEAQCPVLLKPGPTIAEQMQEESDNHRARLSRVTTFQVQQIWKTFKSGAVSCFSFVSPMGLFFLPKLILDSFGITRPVPHPVDAGLPGKFRRRKGIGLDTPPNPGVVTGIPMEQRKQMAKQALTAMSLTEKFGKFVLIVGHGASTVNNPHATGLDCGACGGHTGEANARVAAAVLNDHAVRAYLKNERILIPRNTVFLACLHDTTTDEITIFNEQDVPISSREELAELKRSLSEASSATRAERALRLSVKGNADRAIRSRSKDWSQVRPEWGLAGCSSFIVAPRHRTQGISFDGRAFLHSYDWKKDRGFAILELIMTAPMVVTSWISLQYFASTVDNKNFGAGNKTLHNVTAGIGVLEGFSGDLRTGLPMQSVHDGKKYQHEPLRLNVVVEAPVEAMNIIIGKHQAVRNLLDNGWLNLMAMNDEGKISHRYRGALTWEVFLPTDQA